MVSELTPKQAADVIRYYHDNANKGSRQSGWRDKVSVGEAAIQSILASQSLANDGAPTLTLDEMEAGFGYINNPPVEIKYHCMTPEQEERIDDLVDKRNISYYEAIGMVLGH